MSRESKILELLIKSESTTTIKEISGALQISQTSVRNALDEVGSLAEKNNLELVRKRGIGIVVRGDIFDKNLFMIEHQRTNHVLSKEDIFDCLILQLADSNTSYMTIGDLSQTLFLSRSTIQTYLTEMQDYLKDTGVILETKKKKGVRLVGDEIAIRSLYSKTLSRQKGKEVSNGELRRQIFNTLKIDPDYIFITLRKLQENYDYLFSDESFDALVIHIAIAIRRIMDHMIVQHTVIHDISNYELEFNIAQQVAHDIGKHYNIVFNENEVYFLFLHLISSKMIKERNVVPNVSSGSSDDIVYLISSEIIELVENTKQIHVADVKFLNNLMIHLRPTLNRIEFGFKYENPLRDLIKKEYPVAFGLAWMSNSIIKHYTGNELTDDEAAFIAVHIQSMLESSDHKLRVVIVCSSGIGISQLLCSRLQSHFPTLNIIGTESVYSYKKHSNPNRADLVISTFPIITETPLVQVSPLLTQNDVSLIEAYIKKIKQGKLSIFEDLAIETLLQKSWKSMDEVISEVAKYLLYSKYVTKDFESEVQKREGINSTSIGMHVALPHAAYHTVKKTNLTFVTLREPIKWGEDMVDLVMFIVLTEADSFRLSHKLREVYHSLYSESNHIELIEAKTRESFLDILMKKELV